ncbi:PD40 domain-containing protein [Shewanella avicenniae]|uniref:PD40 domain-containing protein n=1 Tax=Shewanella avicenniae TaxID=2814294 RepID=A0ABX7QUC7_9GAMM|nr:winged helix-turn-helix domain-containing protein [Shewanella avicenniae]QSX34238.1 PD40 domain-containing protein [Shewanella avicenniae]
MPPKYRLNEWVLDPQMLTLTRAEEQIRLESRVMQVLLCLIRHAEQVVTRELLIAEVWSGGLVSDNAINRIIGLLRQSLGDNAKSPQFIRTVPKKGYVLIAEVEVLGIESANDVSEAFATTTPDASGAMVTVDTAPVGQKTQVASSRLIFLSSILVILLILWWWLPQLGSTNTGITQDDIMQIKPLTFNEGQEVDPALSPDGRKLAFAYRELEAEQWQLKLLTLADQSITQLPSAMGVNMRYPAWSRDGNKLAYLRWGADSGCHIMVYNLEQPTAAQAEFTCHQSTQSTSIAWAESGLALFYVDADGVEGYKRLFRLSLVDGRREQLSQPHIAGRGDYAMALSPTGKQMAVLRSIDWFDTQVLLFDIDTGEWRNIVRVGYPLRSIAWNAAGDAMIYRGEAGQLYRLNLASHVIQRITSVASEINSPVSNAAGQLTAVVGELFEEELWYWPVPRTAAPKRWIFSSRRDYKPALSHDGKQLLFVSNRSGLPQIWLRHADGRETQLTHLSSFAHLDELSFAPDDRLVAGALNRKAFVLNPVSGDMTFPSGMDDVRNVEWGRDSQHLLAAVAVDGIWQLRRFAVDSGASELLMLEAFAGKYAADGEIYVTQLHKSGIWHLSHDGLRLVTEQYTPRFSSAWKVAQGRIWWVEQQEHNSQLVSIDLADDTLARQPIAMKNVSKLSLSVAETGDVILSLLSKSNTDIVLLTH